MSKFIYHILAFAVVAIWGVTFISTKILIQHGLEPSQIFALRFILAYAGIWIMSATGGRKPVLWSRNLRDELVFLFLGITGGSFYFLTENTALAYTQACNVSFIVCSTPLITLLMTMAVRRIFKGRLVDGLEPVRLSPGLIAGTCLAVAGMGFIVFDGSRFEFSLMGDILALGAALCWGLYSIFMGQATEDYGAVFATRKVFFYGLITIIPFLLREDVSAYQCLSEPVVLFNILFLGLVASLACFVVWNIVMVKLGNVTSTNYIYLNPFFTLVAAMIVLGERMTPVSAIGSAAVILGVYLSGRK